MWVRRSQRTLVEKTASSHVETVFACVLLLLVCQNPPRFPLEMGAVITKYVCMFIYMGQNYKEISDFIDVINSQTLRNCYAGTDHDRNVPKA